MTYTSPRIPFEKFCPLIHRAQQNHAHLHIEYDGDQLYQVRTTRKPSKPVFTGAPSTTLSDMLQQRHTITRKQKRILAVVLSHGLLHFGANQWLTKEWSKRHISFLQDTPNSMDYSRPYIFTSFEKQTGTPLDDADRVFSIHPNACVLALGILLLEIEMWDNIEKHRHSEDLTDGVTVNPNTDLTAAHRLVEETGDDLYENYKKAIEACLTCDFAPDTEPSLDNEVFRDAFYEHVVLPLETELFHGWSTRVSDL